MDGQNPNISVADDVFLDAKAQFEIWQEEFTRHWNLPVLKTATKLFWMRQPEELRQTLRARKPDAAQSLDDLVAGKER